MFSEKRHSLWWTDLHQFDGTDNFDGICLTGSPNVTKTFMAMLDWMVVRWIYYQRIPKNRSFNGLFDGSPPLFCIPRAYAHAYAHTHPHAHPRSTPPHHNRHDRHHRHRRP